MDKIINIYGGGIAGMTVAHNMINKGFKVNVFEKSNNLEIVIMCLMNIVGEVTDHFITIHLN